MVITPFNGSDFGTYWKLIYDFLLVININLPLILHYFTPFGTLAICRHTGKILRRSSQGNPSVGGVKHKLRGVAECTDFGPIERYISETVQDRS